LDGVIAGKLVIDRIDHVSLTRLKLTGVHVLDNTGRDVASAQRVSVRWQPWQLLHAQVALTRIWVESPRVALGDPTRELGQTGGVLDIVPETEPTDPNAQPSPWTIEMQRVDVTDGQVTLRAEGTDYALRRVHAQASLSVDEHTTVAAERLHAHVTRAGKDVATLSSRHLSYATTDAAAAKLHAWIGPSQIWLNAELGATPRDTKNAAGPQSVVITLHADKFSPTALQAFGIAVEPWNAPVDLKLEAHGDTAALDYQLKVFAREGGAQIRGTWKTPATFALQLRSEGLALRSVINSDVAALSGVVDLRVEAAADFTSAALQVDVPDGLYAGAALPTTHVTGRWSLHDGLNLPEIRMRYPNAHLDASLSLTPEGKLTSRIDLRADALEDLTWMQRAVPGI
jgi:hypothetical protein